MESSTRESELRKLFSRQAERLKPARDWFIATKLKSSFSSVLEVGCGFGDVLHEFEEDIFRVGLDIEREYLKELKVASVLGDGHYIPFRNNSIDLVYCHFALLWFSEPHAVIKEMARVSKKWICCMAEYDYGARLDFPEEFGIIRDRLAEGIIADGGDPYVGRKIHKYFNEAGLEAEVGAYCHVMDRKELLAAHESEWKFIEEFTDIEPVELSKLKSRELETIKAGARFLFTPVFYAVAEK
jgi:SAM-dependent methyltransferase